MIYGIMQNGTITTAFSIKDEAEQYKKEMGMTGKIMPVISLRDWDALPSNKKKYESGIPFVMEENGTDFVPCVIVFGYPQIVS